MLQEQQIKSIVGRISANFKASSSTKKKGDEVWGEAYKHATTFAEQIEVHSEIGQFPEHLMRAKAPNETSEELNYRKECFESITVPYWHRAENSTNRIWAQQNHKIDWIEESIKTYFTSDYPIYGSVLNYFQSVVTKKKIRDPNAVLCVDFDLPVKQNANGEIVPDQSVELKPYASIYESENVLMYEDGQFALLLSEEKSVIQHGNDKSADGKVFYMYDDTNIYRIEQTGKKVDWTFQYSIYYAHNLGYMPAWKLKGIPYEVYADNPVYQSYFIAAVPHLNKAIKLDSTLDASINKIAYPTRAYYEQDCPASGCNDGMIYNASNERSKCTSCNGTGKTKFSPMRDLVHKVPSATDPEALPFPGLAYVSPPSEILQFNETKIDSDIIKAFTFINIDMSSAVNANGTEETATQIRIDREEFYSFLLTFSNEIYQLLYDFAYAAATIRNGGNEVDIVVSAPKTFDLITAAELTTELSNSSLPEIAKRILTTEYLAQRFSQQSEIAKRKEIIDMVDPYAYKSDMEILAMKGVGAIEMWEIILHNKINAFLDEIISENENFLEQPIKKIKEGLIKQAKDRAKEIQNASNPISAEGIMTDIATGQGNDLAQSVGGLTGMIAIVNAVAAGTYDLDAAVALVAQRFGISEEEARKQLGTPKVITSQAEADKVSTLTV